MKRAFNAAQMRAWEEAAARHGMAVGLLMENAGQALGETALKHAANDGRFLVVCGSGNNGGDGLVAARWLAARGRQVRVECIGETAKLSGDAAAALKAVQISQALLGAIPGDFAARAGDVVVDALFGTGLSRRPEGAAADAIQRIARWRGLGARVVSADLPSGLPSDGAAPFSPCVQADATVAFGALKLGHVTAAGASASGAIEVAPIGGPPVGSWPTGAPPVFLLEEADVLQSLPKRSLDSHKGTYGHVLVIAGSKDKPGAAVLCGRAVLRAGAGLCTVASPPSAMGRVLAGAPELMAAPLPADRPLSMVDLPVLKAALDGKAAWLIGPGIERGPETAALLLELLSANDAPAVLDADALNALGAGVERLKRAHKPMVLTPHPGEMARLLDLDTAGVQSDRHGAARELASRTGAVVVLKGARTVIATPEGEIFVNPTGNPGMATAGSGDVLGGIIAGLLAQKIPAMDAVIAAVYAHGAAGDHAALRMGQQGLIASDLIESLGTVWARWQR